MTTIWQNKIERLKRGCLGENERAAGNRHQGADHRGHRHRDCPAGGSSAGFFHAQSTLPSPSSRAASADKFHLPAFCQTSWYLQPPVDRPVTVPRPSIWASFVRRIGRA